MFSNNNFHCSIHVSNFLPDCCALLGWMVLLLLWDVRILGGPLLLSVLSVHCLIKTLGGDEKASGELRFLVGDSQKRTLLAPSVSCLFNSVGTMIWVLVWNCDVTILLLLPPYQYI